MITVRSKLTGLTAVINEKAFAAFAGNYERLDQPAPQPDEPAQPDPAKTTSRRAAPKEKE
ncbi:hypothetical protein ACIBG7_15225 [Nonomuraea sp. NPDC050328]|uniref:hypothetical protein n=1 Tax=Nonomuraea sp. NPDC050328 TaxID=3364361 RepID=UPI0037A0802D